MRKSRLICKVRLNVGFCRPIYASPDLPIPDYQNADKNEAAFAVLREHENSNEPVKMAAPRPFPVDLP